MIEASPAKRADRFWMTRMLPVCLMVCGVGVSVLSAQPPGDPSGQGPGRPTEYGIRFTPEMARAMAGFYVRQMLQERYGLDASKEEAATEAIARRLMQMAHRLDEQGYGERFERMVEKMLKSQAERPPNRKGVPPEVGRAMGETLAPIVPELRRMMRGVAQDVRPMLSPKAQLKFAADVIAADTAMEGFQKTMQRWAEGDVGLGDEVFGEPVQRDANGRSAALNRAEQRAAAEVAKKPWSRWEQYVADAKVFYGFDDAQCAAADSLLREAIAKAEQVTADPSYAQRVHDNRLLFNLLWPLRIDGAHPLRFEVKSTYEAVTDPVERIGEELKRKVDAIATQGQREAAEQRMASWLTEAGYSDELFEPEQISAPGGSDATATESTPPPAEETNDTP